MRGEFEFIESIRAKHRLLAVGDDCAVLPQSAELDLLMTADLLIEDVDFRLEWTTPEALGHKALAVSLSDIAAMGGEPGWAMTSIGVPERVWKLDFLDRFYEGWHSLAHRYGVELVGGDVSRTNDKLVIDSIVSGSVPSGKAVLRSGARPGDAIYVSGKLGGAAGGLRLVEFPTFRNDKLTASENRLVGRQIRPEPCIELGKRLRESGYVNAMIDVSDGLIADLEHICRAGRVGAQVDAGAVPVDRDLYQLAHLDDMDALSMALGGGEDFELLFTADETAIATLGVTGITRIGSVTDLPGTLDISLRGRPFVPRQTGFRHF